MTFQSDDGTRLKVKGSVTIHPLKDIDVCSIFYSIQELLRHFTENHKCQTHGVSRRKVKRPLKKMS